MRIFDGMTSLKGDCMGFECVWVSVCVGGGGGKVDASSCMNLSLHASEVDFS